MRKKNTIIKVFLVFSLFFLMTNCSTEEIGKQNVSHSSNEAKIWFDVHKDDYDASFLKFIKELQWQNTIVSTGEIGEIVEVPFTLAGNLSAATKEAGIYNDHHRLMFVKDVQKGFKLFYVQIFADVEDYNIQDKNYNYYNIKDNFDGSVYVKELATNIGSKIQFKDGEKVEHSNTGKMQEYACVYYGYWSSDGSFSALYEVGCYGGSGGNGVPSSGSGENPGPGYGGGGSPSSSPSEGCPLGYKYKLGECVLNYAILTDPTFVNNPCLKSVYDKLKGSQTFQNYLKKFDGKFSVANLKLAASNTMPSNINADTSPPQNYLIQITLNSTNLNRPGLDIKSTFLHEMIHAEMFRVLLSLSSSNGNIDVSTLNKMLTQHNYPGMYDYYTRFGINGMQHEQMAAHYREIMVSFLKDYDNTLTAAEYESIAWEGLKGTTSWDSKSSQEKQNITNTYNSWKTKAGNNCN